MGNSQWQENEPLSDINVTPFVDVLLVLLIIFMITAPIINHVIKVDLPKDSYNQDKMKPVQTPLRITLDKEGVVYVGETRIGDSLNEENQGIFKKSVDLWTQKQKPPWIVDVEAHSSSKVSSSGKCISKAERVCANDAGQSGGGARQSAGCNATRAARAA